jgi:hypothetical protein
MGGMGLGIVFDFGCSAHWVEHRFGQTCGVQGMGGIGMGTVSQFGTHWITVHPTVVYGFQRAGPSLSSVSPC